MDYRVFMDDAPDMSERVDLYDIGTSQRFLEDSYAFWNKNLFGGRLPKAGVLTLGVTERSGVGGYASKIWKEDLSIDDLRSHDASRTLYKCTDCELYIKMSVFGLNNESFHQTLIHEMCHLACWFIDCVYEVGNTAADGYLQVQDKFLARGLFNTPVVPGHSECWKKWMDHCGVDPRSGQFLHSYEVDQAVDYTKMKQARQSRIKAFIPNLKELAKDFDVSVLPVLFWVDPQAGLNSIGVNSRKVECNGLLCVFQLWNPSGKRAPLSNSRSVVMYLAFKTKDASASDKVQSALVTLDSIKNLDMCGQFSMRGVMECEKFVRGNDIAWIQKLQRILGNKLNPRERMTPQDLRELMIANIFDTSTIR